jgi:voltage-gated potassium channel
MTHGLRSSVGKVLGVEDGFSRAKIAVKGLLIGAIATSVAAVALETVESLAGRYREMFMAIETAAVAVLTIEYALRLWVAPERNLAETTAPWKERVRYAVSAFGLIDVVAVLPAYINLLLSINPDWLRVLRMLRLLKIARYAPGLPLFFAVLRNESRPLLAVLIAMVVLLMLESSIMFVLERQAQPMTFASIPHALWWAIVTMSTVGYGDVSPVTALGKVFGGLVMIIGIAMFAVPAGILATGFAVEIRKRDFVVTWQTVAKVPLFVNLDAARIAEIAHLLRRQVLPPKYAVVRRGEPADVMFFIMSGEVEVDVQPSPRRLGPGQFFGEIGLLSDMVRTATVTTVTECELLALEISDFRRLLDAHPDLRAAITKVAEQRLAASETRPSDAPPA